MTTTDRTYLIWDWCREAYSQFGNWRLNFPKNTDQTKTYQWRYLQALERKFSEWEFSDDLCKEFIIIAVQHAKQNKIMRKGLSIFLQDNLLQKCYNKLRESANKDNDILSILRRTKSFLDNNAANSHCNIVDLLMFRNNIGGYRNITNWYGNNQLPELYVALSRSCGIVIARLVNSNDNERKLLPNDAKLFLARASILRNKSISAPIRDVLDSDWKKCL